MKRLLLSAMIAVSALTAMADLNGNGYYRVQNALTKRYAYLIDNTGAIDVPTSSADVAAVELYSGFLRASSDPSTILYIENIQGSEYNIAAQGTSLYDFLGQYMNIKQRKEYDGQMAYMAYGSMGPVSKYLGDLVTDLSEEQGIASVEADGDNRMWYIHPLETASSEGYFGIAPTLTSSGKYYYPLYAAFPYSPYSDGVKIYIVSKIDAANGVVVIKEVKGTIPSGSAVIVECANPLASDNRVTVGSGTDADLSGNALKGVYFNIDKYRHKNQTPYDKASMRLLAVKEDRLVFETADCDFLPRNQAYLYLPESDMRAVGEYVVVKEEDYDKYVASLGSIVPDGYYRMQNASTNRYVSVIGSEGSVGSSPDFNAFGLYSDILRANSDPSTVLRMSKPEGSSGSFDRDIAAQGTSFTNIFGTSLRVSPVGASDELQKYYAEVPSAGGSYYLGDGVAAGSETGSMATDTQAEARQWWFKPIENSSSGNFFGVAPTQTAGGKYYSPFMADFPFKAAGSGMNVYTISTVDPDLGMVVMKPAEGYIPAGTAVIVECAGPLASDNLLEIGENGEKANVSGNQLTAVYFDSSVAGHDNRTPYDAKGMRSLAVVNGKLVFKAADTDYVERNMAFLNLGSETQKCVDSYEVVTQEAYDAKLDEIASAVASGYYRLRNVSTDRTLCLLDDKGSLSNNKSDLGAFRTYSDLLHVNSDPASVFHITDGPGSPLDHNLCAQGTSFNKIVKSYVKVLPTEGSAFSIYTVSNGVRKYLSDTGSEEGCALSAESDGVSAQWNLDEIDSDSDSNWFGVAPTVTAGGKYYYPFMADFPVAPASEGVRLLYINKIDPAKKAVVYKVMEGEAPARTPLIVECPAPLAADNRLSVGEGDNQEVIKTNYLRGVWFDCDITGHVNRTTYNSDGMRVLGATDEGLAFVKGDMEYLPRNQAYLSLDGMRQKEVETYRVLDWDEYENLGGSVESISLDAIVDVYRIDGTLVKDGVVRSDVPNLGSGVYILRSGSASEKLIVH